MRRTLRRLGPAFWSVAALLAAGCGESGPPTAHLSGTVTINGQPLPADTSGDIVFTPVDKANGPAVTVSIEGGRYDSPKTPKGAVKAYFNVNQAVGPEVTSERGNKTRATKSIVPPRAGNGIELQVDADNDAQNFNLE